MKLLSDFDYFELIYINLPIDDIYNIICTDEKLNIYKTDYNTHQPDKLNAVMRSNYSKKFEEKYYMDILFYQSKYTGNTIALGSWGTLCNYICSKIKTYNISFRFIADGSYAGFEKRDYINSETQQRVVQSLIGDNDKWEFYQNGEPIFFENTDYYTKRRIADRMNKDIIIEYVQRFGIPINKPDCLNYNDRSLYITTLQ